MPWKAAFTLTMAPTWSTACRIPRPGRRELLGRLDEILAEQAIELLIPTLDTELQGLLKLRDELAAAACRCSCLGRKRPKHAARRSCRSWLAAAAAKTPKSFNAVDEAGLLTAAAKIGYPLMLKGPYYGAYRVHDERTLVQCFAYTIAVWGGPVVVQECITVANSM